MPAEFDWSDAEDLGIMLHEKFPTVDPLTVRFTDLHRYVTELPGFIGDAKLSNEPKLEAIQMAWHEEWKEQGGMLLRCQAPPGNLPLGTEKRFGASRCGNGEDRHWGVSVHRQNRVRRSDDVVVAGGRVF